MPSNGTKWILLGLVAFIVVVAAALYNKSESTLSTQPAGQDQPEPAKVNQAVHISSQVEKSCMSCHAVDANNKLARIEYVRKSPEGWDQTIQRMQRIHGVQLTDEERAILVQDLSKERGLAPEEASKVQYWMAQKPSYTEPATNPNVENACITCHAGGRFMAQRRSEEEWKNLKDFHLVMFPSIYLNHRHLDWPVEADAALEYLAKEYPLETKEWSDWKGKSAEVEGKWKVAGFQGTKGFYIGDSEFTKTPEGYTEKKSLRYLESGNTVNKQANVKLFAGYMLRSSYEGDQGKEQGYFNVRADGKQISGDWSMLKDKGIAGEEKYFKVEGNQPQIIHMEPQAVKRGGPTKVTLYGVNLNQWKPEQVKLPAGISMRVLSTASSDEIQAEIKVDSSVQEGSFTLGDMFQPSLTVYDTVDSIKITPSYAVSRIGGAGPMDKVSTQFVAYAYSNGKDGKRDTEDDLKLMPVQANWSLAAYPEGKEDEDFRYIGTIDPKSGLFTPSVEGVNPKRPFTGENVGSVSVAAKATVGGQKLSAQTHLVVTVPDYNNLVN